MPEKKSIADGGQSASHVASTTYHLVRKSSTREWLVVVRINGRRDEAQTYYTGDKQDAIDTMAAMKATGSTALDVMQHHVFLDEGLDLFMADQIYAIRYGFHDIGAPIGIPEYH